LVRAAVAFAPPGLPMIATAHLDPVVLAFALITTAASVAGFGIAPALRGARSAPYGIHHFGARSMTLTPLATMTRRALVAAQVALAVVILSGAGVLSHTLVGLQQVPLGFTPDHLLFFRLDWMLPSLPVSPSVFMTRWHGFIDRLAQVSPATPGLGPITTTLVVPFGGAAAQTQYTLDGRIPAAGRPFELTDIDYALPDYFAVMGIPLRGGRTFDVHDNDAHGPPVIIVNESFAHQAWPNQDPLGHRLRFRADTAGRWFTVVGVVGDARYADLAAPPHPTVYQSPGQGIEGDPWLAVRTRGDPAQADSLLEHVIEGADPAFGISRTTTGPELLSTRLARPRALATLFGGLAGTALLLAALGLFGVLSAYVRERRREIAIRSALGATPTRLRALVVGQAIGVAAAGIACGLPLALASSHVLRAMVSEVRPVDALTAVAVVVVLLMVVVLATYGPMVRASRADPRIALASE
jgi:predicted permease